MGYECLLAGLPDLKAGGDAPLKQQQLEELLWEYLKENDQEQFRLLLMSSSDPVFKEQSEQYDSSIIGQPVWWEDAREMLSEDDLLTQLLYEYGKKKGCKFLRQWFQYNQDLNNVLAAAICRKHGFDVRRAVVGDNEVAQILRRNLPQKDFGLAGVMDELQDILQVSEIENLLERERRLDALRFMWLEDKTCFVIFSLENVLAYWLQSQMLNRWSSLTVEEGEKVFRDMVADMKKGVNL